MMSFAIALGGAAGALSRYAVSLLVLSLYGGGFQPLATMAVNILGSGMMGFCFVLFSAMNLAEPLRGLLMVGFLGGLTTFSAFSLDALVLFEKGQMGLAAAYIAASVVVSLLSFVLMMLAARALLVGA